MKYKIKNHIIDAKSPVEALKIHKLLDTVKDGPFEKGQAYYYAHTGDYVDVDGKKYQINSDYGKIGYSNNIGLTEVATGNKIKISKKDFIEKATLLRDSVKDAVSLRKGEWFVFRGDTKNIYKVIDDKIQKRDGFDESLLAEHYEIDYSDGIGIFSRDLVIRKNGTVTFTLRHLRDIVVFNSTKEAMNWFKRQLKWQSTESYDSVKDDDYSYEVIKKQITNENFTKDLLLKKAYNGLTRGSMSKEEYHKLVEEIKSMRDSIKDIDYNLEKEIAREHWKGKTIEEIKFLLKKYNFNKKIGEYNLSQNIKQINLKNSNEDNLILKYDIRNGKIKEAELNYKILDSIKDDDIDYLSQEEEQAIEDYKKAIANTKDVKLLKLFAHILKEETEHLEELQNEEVEDSVKDEIKKKYYFVPDDSYGQHGTDIWEIYLTKEEAKKVKESRVYDNTRGFLTESYTSALYYTQD